VRIVAGRHEVVHERQHAHRAPSRLPEHRAAHLAALSGTRAKRYLRRQHLFETGEAAVRYLTELVHLHPRTWYHDVDELHELLQQVGPEAMDRAFRAALDVDQLSTAFVAQCLGRAAQPLPLVCGEGFR
jgi:hypothetical protein